MEQSFIAYIENSIKENWDLDALTDYKGATLQYKDVARKIEKLHIIFEASGIRKGDKIAVCGRNSSHWGVTFLATLTYGAVIVPILHEFKADNVHNIVNHSEAKATFCRRSGMGKPQRKRHAAAGRYLHDDGLHPAGVAQRTCGLCPRTPQRNVRQKIPQELP